MSKTKPKSKTAPRTASAPSAPSPIFITLEIFPPDAKNVRKLIVSGAPRNEMPELRSGTFADRHQLLDEVYIAVMKRTPQIVRASAAFASTSDDKDDPQTENASETAAQSEAEKELEESIAEVKTETEPVLESPAAESSLDYEMHRAEMQEYGDLHRADLAVTQAAAQLPLIEGDPTLPATAPVQET